MGKLLYSPELEKLSLRSTSTIILAQLPQSSPLDFVSTQSNVIDQLLAPCFVSFLNQAMDIVNAVLLASSSLTFARFMLDEFTHSKLKVQLL